MVWHHYADAPWRVHAHCTYPQGSPAICQWGSKPPRWEISERLSSQWGGCVPFPLLLPLRCLNSHETLPVRESVKGVLELVRELSLTGWGDGVCGALKTLSVCGKHLQVCAPLDMPLRAIILCFLSIVSGWWRAGLCNQVLAWLCAWTLVEKFAIWQ